MKPFFIILSLFVLTALFLPDVLTGPESFHIQLQNALAGPSNNHWLGTDGLGRDISAQVLLGIRTSLLLSTVVVLMNVAIGVIFGGAAGYLGGALDRFFLFIADVMQAFPGMLLVIATAAFLPQRILFMILLLSAVGWVSYARVVRAQIIAMREREFVLAGTALGYTRRRLLLRHLLPNMLGPLIVQASFGLAGVVLVESTLSFLGLGLPEHVPSLGRLLDSGVNLLLVAPHVAFFPGLAVMGLVFIFNAVGENLKRRYA